MIRYLSATYIILHIAKNKKDKQLYNIMNKWNNPDSDDPHIR